MVNEGDPVIGWPDLYGVRTVYRRRNPAAILGYIRSTHDPVRYFAETRRREPIEGTFRTRTAAFDALLAHIESENA